MCVSVCGCVCVCACVCVFVCFDLQDKTFPPLPPKKKKVGTNPGVVIEGSHLQDGGANRDSLQHCVRVVQRVPAWGEEVTGHFDTGQGRSAPRRRPTVLGHNSSLGRKESVKVAVCVLADGIG